LAAAQQSRTRPQRRQHLVEPDMSLDIGWNWANAPYRPPVARRFRRDGLTSDERDGLCRFRKEVPIPAEEKG
jgi:hypothetical protein